MAKRAIDRRVARTRGMLQHALISLILKQDYEAITVEDICEAANVGRSTFYAHYSSKDDLKRRGLEEHLRTLLADRQKDALATPEDRDRSLGFSLTMFEHARDHADLHRALVGSRGGTIVHGSIRQILSDLVRKGLAEIPVHCTGQGCCCRQARFLGDSFLVSIAVHIPQVACRFPAVGYPFE